MEEFMTAAQRERAERNKEICSELVRLRSEHADLKDERIFQYIGKQYHMTTGNVRLICKNAGLC